MLRREYAKLGEVELAEEFDKKVSNLFDKSLGPQRIRVPDNLWGKALVLSAKGQWKEANEFFENFFEKKDSLWGSGKEIANRNDYAWALEKQGRIEEARVQLELADKIRQKVKERTQRIEHANVQAYLITQREIGVGEELSIRLDLVNVSKKSALPVKIEGLISSEFKPMAMPSYCSLEKAL
jgi:tetratricopeptide (TPR) repeat protein